MTEVLYHFIGIGGIGMSGLARILLERGKRVTGSDMKESYVTAGLEKQGATVHIGHHEANIVPGSTVIVSSDIPKGNPEIQAAEKYQCRLLHRSDLLLELMHESHVLAIGGTHGKTTTTALLTHVLKCASWDPSFAVGGMMTGLESNASQGKGEYFVAEADESDGTFLKYNYHSAIVTNIDTDHLAHYGSWEVLVASFQQFIQKAKGKSNLFYCIDDPMLEKMDIQGIGYGFSEKAQLRASHLRQTKWSISFDISFEGKSYPDVEVQLTGKHNALNALAVFGLALTLGVPLQDIRKGLSTFAGVKRRMEKKGEESTVVVLDDYGHHPTELKVTLKALRCAVSEKRVIAVFQPHRYSRMQHCYKELKGAFNDADIVVVTDLFTGGEAPIEGISTEVIVNEIIAHSPIPVHYIARGDLVEKLHSLVRPHDVVITLGAGDVTKVGGDLVDLLKKKPPQKYRVGLLFGGMNCEHEVSCVSAKNFVHNLNENLYDLHAFQIGLDGRFRKSSLQLEAKERASDEIISPEIFSELLLCDLFVPVLHGPFGEDGRIQGFLEMLRKPYIGCDLHACAVSMDKALVKTLALAHDIPTVCFIDFDAHQWRAEKESCLQKAIALGFPLFVKPTHLGSSVGVVKVLQASDLEEAVEFAFQYDTHLLVEKAVVGREIEFAVLGNSLLETATPGEILTNGAVYTYEKKYGKNGFAATPRAELSDEQIAAGKALAEKAYRIASCQGLARVDFFLDQEGTFWLNEINPMPGFTPNSLYPKMWEEAGVCTKDLLDKLIILALERSRMQERVFEFSCKKLSR